MDTNSADSFDTTEVAAIRAYIRKAVNKNVTAFLNSGPFLKADEMEENILRCLRKKIEAENPPETNCEEPTTSAEAQAEAEAQVQPEHKQDQAKTKVIIIDLKNGSLVEPGQNSKQSSTGVVNVPLSMLISSPAMRDELQAMLKSGECDEKKLREWLAKKEEEQLAKQKAEEAYWKDWLRRDRQELVMATNFLEYPRSAATVELNMNKLQYNRYIRVKTTSESIEFEWSDYKRKDHGEMRKITQANQIFSSVKH